MTPVFLTVAWLAGATYATIPSFWLIVHLFTPHWRARQSSPYGILLLYWFGVIALLLVVSAGRRQVRLYTTPLALLPAMLLVFFSLSIYWNARKSFPTARLIGRPELDPDRLQQKLVTTGLHSRVRHPIYLGHFCTLAAMTIASGLVVLYGFMVFAVVTGWWMIQQEDRELEMRFGEEYREYKRRVPAIVPGL